MKAAIAIVAVTLLAACAAKEPPPAVRVGYFPNVTHSQALIGIARGDFQRRVGRVEPVVFNAGPAVIEALFAGRIDLAYVGPAPTINGWVRSHGEALHIVAGATSGGAALVVRRDAHIQKAADLTGKRLASPQLGNTQDVALRRYLAANGLKPRENGGTVDIVPTANPQILDLFRRGDIDGAWLPEPWASRVVYEGNGVVLVDERSLWPRGEFVTAHVIAGTKFLRAHPDVVRAWLDVHVDITRWELAHPAEARAIVNGEIARLTGRRLPDALLASAWERMRPTWDPIAPSLVAGASDLNGIYDLTLLDGVLRAKGLQ